MPLTVEDAFQLSELPGGTPYDAPTPRGLPRSTIHSVGLALIRRRRRLEQSAPSHAAPPPGSHYTCPADEDSKSLRAAKEIGKSGGVVRRSLARNRAG